MSDETPTAATSAAPKGGQGGAIVAQLESIPFDNRTVNKLPVDLERHSTSRLKTPGVCFSTASPTPVLNPVLVAYSKPGLEDLLGVEVEEGATSPGVATTDTTNSMPLDAAAANVLAEYFSGNTVLRGASPAAHCYCGHQFGSFAGQLGDGAALYLGEVSLPPKNEVVAAAVRAQTAQRQAELERLREKQSQQKQERLATALLSSGSTQAAATTATSTTTGGGAFAGRTSSPTKRDVKQFHLSDVPRPPVVVKDRRSELQLKGAGPTVYSRSADGRKVLRSSLREFICSEAVHALGIPTTRALTLVTSDSTVERDPVYSGKVIQERCTVISRVAPTFLRFGSFQICNPVDPRTGAAGPSHGYTGPVTLGSGLGKGGGGGGESSLGGGGGGGTIAANGTTHEYQILHQLWEYTIEHFFPDVVRSAMSSYEPSLSGVTLDDEGLAQMRKRFAEVPLGGFVRVQNPEDIEGGGEGSTGSGGGGEGGGGSSSSKRSHTGGAQRTLEKEKEAQEKAKAQAQLEGGHTPFQLFLNTNLHLKADITIAVFTEIVKRTAELVAQWQCVGFCHGVLNTDNMSILGLTIDYGPYGFMTHFDEDYVCNTSDDSGRYSYKKQPEYCKWNCVQLANSLSLLFGPGVLNEAFYHHNNRSEDSGLRSPRAQGNKASGASPGSSAATQTTNEILMAVKERVVLGFNDAVSEGFDKWYQAKRTELLRKKLGLVKGVQLDVEKRYAEKKQEKGMQNDEEEEEDSSPWKDKEVQQILDLLFRTLQATGADFSETFLALKAIKLYEARELNAQLLSEVQEAQKKMISSVVTRIVASCAPIATVKKTLEKRIRGLRSGMSPQQVMALLNLAEEDPEALDQMFHAPREAVIEGLEQEKTKIIQRQGLMEKHQALREKEAEDGGLENMQELLEASNTTMWTDFVNHYYEMLQLRQHPDDDDGHQERRRHVSMEASNPKFILRPWILQSVILAAEGGTTVGGAFGSDGNADLVGQSALPGAAAFISKASPQAKKGPDFARVQQLLERVLTPFQEDPRDGLLWDAGCKPPEEAMDICVSCSS